MDSEVGWKLPEWLAQSCVQPEDSHHWWPRGWYWGQSCLISLLMILVDCAAVPAHCRWWETGRSGSCTRVVLPCWGTWTGQRNMTGSSWYPTKGYGQCWPWAGAAPCTATGWGWPQKGPWGPGGLPRWPKAINCPWGRGDPPTSGTCASREGSLLQKRLGQIQ